MRNSVYIAAALAGALTLTGCTNSVPEEPRPTAVVTSAPTQTKTPSPATSPSGTPKPTPTSPEPSMSILPISPEKEADAQLRAEKASIATVYQGFYEQAEALTLKEVDSVNTQLYNSGIMEPSANEWREGYKNVVPQILNVDSSKATEEKRVQFYLDLRAMPELQEGKNTPTVLIPGDAITVNGSTATIDLNSVDFTVDGKPVDLSSRIKDGAKINLNKKDGSWLLVLDDGLMWNAPAYNEATGK